MPIQTNPTADLRRAVSCRANQTLRSLEGLSIGDAFGELFFWNTATDSTQLPPGPWPWTDDTHMALSVVEVLFEHGCIEQDALARAFAERFVKDPHRGYASGAAALLAQLDEGEDWRDAAPALFVGGSFGNGGAMRAAPIGGFFAGEPEAAALQAMAAAAVTHAHIEGQAGAAAVAAGAAIAASPDPPVGAAFIDACLPFVPQSLTLEALRRAARLPSTDIDAAVHNLGSGQRVSAQDTVPYCLWCAAHHLDDYEAALWTTSAGRGDCDTTCAIVGGIVALAADHVPAAWLLKREPLPPAFQRS